MKKQVIFDDVIFRLQRVGGISAVFYQLISRVKEDVDFECHLIATTKNEIDNFYWKNFKSVKIAVKKHLPNFLLQFWPYFFLSIKTYTIFHSTYYKIPIFKSKYLKYVITVHDLGYEYGIMRTGIRRILNIYLKKLAIIRADGIICVSHTTCQDLYKFYGEYLRDKKIEVIYNGLNESFYNQHLNILSTRLKTVLFVGGRQGYKNFNQVVKAVSTLEDFELVILGGGPLSQEHIILLDLAIPNRYSFCVDVREDELINHYKSAYCLVYPSSFEGFGLPIIEAMACCCPVIACSNSAIIEISGDSAVLISDPQSDNIVAGIKSLENEGYRLELIKKGYQHAKLFNWANTWMETKNFYTELLIKKDNSNINKN